MSSALQFAGPVQRSTVAALFLLSIALAPQKWLASAFSPGAATWRSSTASSTYRPLGFLSCSDRATSLRASTDETILDANDLDLLSSVFGKYAKDGLMSKRDVLAVPAIAELLKSGDVLVEELDEIWDASPKSREGDGEKARIDVDGFVRFYRTIDDLFEDDDEELENKITVEAAVPAGDEVSELTGIFATIAKDGKLTKEGLKNWDEVETLFADTMLGEDEFDQLWDEACPGKSMDEAGFLKFNSLLDSLFEFVDEDLDEKMEDSGDDDMNLVDGENDPGELFELLKSAEGVVGLKEIQRWGELQEMLADRDILLSEVNDIFEAALTDSQSKNALDKAGFRAFYAGIDDLFEEEDEDDVPGDGMISSSLKDELLRALLDMNGDENRLPCGLESTESEENLIMDLVKEIEKDERNLIRSKQGGVEPADLAGEWEMLYSSSSAMKFNKGLSGIGGSFPNGKFGGLRQTLKATSVMMDVEYSEFIKVNPSASSFNVRIDGNWSLRQSVSIFSGEPSIVLSVEPNRVSYGPTSTRADHWKSLGPMNMLDVTFLDDDIRIMRGNTAVDSIFIFKKIRE